MTEAVESSKTSAVFYQTTWRQSSKMNVIYLSSKILRKLSGKNRQLFFFFAVPRTKQVFR